MIRHIMITKTFSFLSFMTWIYDVNGLNFRFNWQFYFCFLCTAWKVSKYGVFSGLYFSAFGLNTGRYGVSLRIQAECGKIRARKNSVFGHFSGRVNVPKCLSSDFFSPSNSKVEPILRPTWCLVWSGFWS